MIKLNIYGKSDVGLAREHNEDAFLIGSIVENKEDIYTEICLESSFIKKYGFLTAVADGMGGHAAGEIASGLALNYLSKSFLSSQNALLQNEEIIKALKDSIIAAHNAILNMSKTNPDYSGMGTTLVGTCFTGNKLYVYNVGDSRLYRFRNGGLRQLTKDHSLVQTLIDTGQITHEESRSHSQKNVITNSLGGGDNKCTPDIADNLTYFEGDIFLLCSDGLSDMLDEEATEEILVKDISIKEKVISLINLANEKGGKDNITVVLIFIEGG